jgi:hypothetical protein
MNWYSKVTKDIGLLGDAVEYYEAELANAKVECKIYGNIEKAAASMPGVVEHRYGQLQEIEAILEFLNIELRRLKTSYFRKYLENYQRALSSRDCDRFVEGEPDVVDFEKLVNEFALLRNKWLGISRALDVKGFSLNNVVKLRCAGIEDATL